MVFVGTFAKPHNPTLSSSFAKEPPSQGATTDQMNSHIKYR